MGMIMHDDVPYGEGTSYTQGTGIAINNNIIAVDADNTPTKNSEKPVKSKGVYSALESNRDESTSLLKSTVGWTGKNLLKINMLQSPYTYNGITLTKNSDGSIRVSGTSTGGAAINIAYFDVESNVKYILTGTPDDIVNPTDNFIRAHREENTYIWQALDNGNGAIIQRTNSERIWIDIRIAAGVTINTTFYPMIRDASITDDTYEPYHETVTEQLDEFTSSVSPVNSVVTFSDLNPDYGYELYVDIPDETTSLPTNLTDLTVCKWTKVQRSTKADGTITLAYTVTNINVNYCLRILK